MSGVYEQVCECDGRDVDLNIEAIEARDRADFEAATRRMATEIVVQLPWSRCTRVKIDPEIGRIVEAEFGGD